MRQTRAMILNLMLLIVLHNPIIVAKDPSPIILRVSPLVLALAITRHMTKLVVVKITGIIIVAAMCHIVKLICTTKTPGLGRGFLWCIVYFPLTILHRNTILLNSERGGNMMKIYLTFLIAVCAALPAVAYQAGPTGRANFGSAQKQQAQPATSRTFTHYNSRWSQGVQTQGVETAVALLASVTWTRRR